MSCQFSETIPAEKHKNQLLAKNNKTKNLDDLKRK